MIRKISFFVVSIFLIGSFVWTEERFAPTFDQCIRDWAANQGQTESNQKSLTVPKLIGGHSLCVIRAIDHHNGFFAAIAAFVVAWFTFALDRSTISLWRTEERNFRAAQRAFVFIDGFNFELNHEQQTEEPIGDKVGDIGYFPRISPIPRLTHFAVQPRWGNSGNTPTKRMIIKVCWHNPGSPFTDDYAYRFPANSFFVAPKAVQAGEFVEITGGQALVDYGWNPVGQEPLMLIWGRADYEDIFGVSHFVEWCYRVRFDRHDGKNLRAQLIQWGPHNRSD